MARQLVGGIGLVVSLGLVSWSAICGIGGGTARVRALEGGRIPVSANVQRITCEPACDERSLVIDRDSKGAVIRKAIWLPQSGLRTITLDAASTGSATQPPFVVNVTPRRNAVPAAIGIALLVLLLPYALMARVQAKDEDKNAVGPWYLLLSEAQGGLSLARVQLMVWFAPAIVLYGAVCITTLQFAELPGSLAALLGMSGATVLLGAAANPKEGKSAPVPSSPAASPNPLPPFPVASQPAGPSSDIARPSFSDLVKDWQDRGDLSRYQYLLLACVGAAVLVVGFFADGSLPELPSEFLAVVGASQATYLGTKAVKTAQSAV
jgi:hypothetical protein